LAQTPVFRFVLGGRIEAAFAPNCAIVHGDLIERWRDRRRGHQRPLGRPLDLTLIALV
jgi:hypothetical protein